MLKVNEIFGPTIQGEGKSQGKEVMFIRLALCNLYCVWCDTPYTWNWEGTKYAHPDKYKEVNEVHPTSDQFVLNKLRSLSKSCKHIVISGGEPLVQQKALVSLLTLLRQNGYYVEIETNGTVTPIPEVFQLVMQFNCSPKLNNSGVELKHRLKPQALSALSTSGKANFKFVISTDEDVKEIIDLVNVFKLKEVYLMAEGRTEIELDAKRIEVHSHCIANGFKFTERLHIIRWGSKRAV